MRVGGRGEVGGAAVLIDHLNARWTRVVRLGLDRKYCIARLGAPSATRPLVNIVRIAKASEIVPAALFDPFKQQRLAKPRSPAADALHKTNDCGSFVRPPTGSQILRRRAKRAMHSIPSSKGNRRPDDPPSQAGPPACPR